MKHPAIAIVFLLLFHGFSAADAPPLETSRLEKESDKISYSLGHQIGTDFRKQKRTIDYQAFLQGMLDSLGDTPPAIAQEQMAQILADTKKQLIRQQREEQRQTRKKSSAADEKFLAENAKKEGVVVLPSGLQYKIVQPGAGKQPGPTDKVKVHYKGTYVDGTSFGSSYNKSPQTFFVNKVIPGLTEGLQLMKEGAKWDFYVREELAYGKRSPSENRAVIFEIELLAVEPSE